MGLERLTGHNSGWMIGVTPNSLNIRDGRRVTVTDAWLTPAVRGRPNLKSLTGHQVLRIGLEGNSARSLDVIGQGKPLPL